MEAVGTELVAPDTGLIGVNEGCADVAKGDDHRRKGKGHKPAGQRPRHKERRAGCGRLLDPERQAVIGYDDENAED